MKIREIFILSSLSVLVGAALAGPSVAESSTATVRSVTTAISIPLPQAMQDSIDYVHALPTPSPRATHARSTGPASTMAPKFSGSPGHSTGSTGNGIKHPTSVPVAESNPAMTAQVQPYAYGSSNHPYTTATVNAKDNQTSSFYPFRAAGRLFYKKPDGKTYSCSAALIKPGIVVTAAHCVAGFNKTFFSDWKYHPAYNKGSDPYGIWDVTQARVMTSYYDGTDTCSDGVTCTNDIAILVLAPKTDARTGAKYYAGNNTGWFNYGWNGYGFSSFLDKTAAQITELGYPDTLDGAQLMERTDSLGYTDSDQVNNTILGSLQWHGASGGPWVVNLGMAPVATGLTSGTDTGTNVIVGVYSWLYDDTGIQEVGASPFTDGNIVKLVNDQCAATPAAC